MKLAWKVSERVPETYTMAPDGDGGVVFELIKGIGKERLTFRICIFCDGLVGCEFWGDTVLASSRTLFSPVED